MGHRNPVNALIYQRKLRKRKSEHFKTYAKNWYRNNKKKYRDWELRYQYGITLKEYNAMGRKQGHRCYVCKRHRKEQKRALSVDHCHRTGKVRKLLCDRCNIYLGWMEKNPGLTLKLLRYADNPKFERI